MSINNNTLLDEKGEKLEKINENQFHQNTLQCLRDCCNYNFLISCNGKNNFKYTFSFKINSSKKNIFILNNLSSNEIMQIIAEKSSIINDIDLFPNNFNNMFNKSDIEIEQTIKGRTLQFPVDPKIMNFNFIDYSKIDNQKGINLVIKFDLNDKNDIFILNKYVLNNLLTCKINANLHEGKYLLENDFFFLMDIKKIIKSIQKRLENLQKKNMNNTLDKINHFFVPLLEYGNIGIIISPNSECFPFNINEIKTNFNSIVKQKFILNSILIALNISPLFRNTGLNFENLGTSKSFSLLKNIKINSEKNKEYINDETTSESSNYNSYSPKISQIIDNQFNENQEFRKMSVNDSLNNSLCLSNNNLYNNFLNEKEIDINYSNIQFGNKFNVNFFKNNKKSYKITKKNKLFRYNTNSYYNNSKKYNYSFYLNDNIYLIQMIFFQKLYLIDIKINRTLHVISKY